MNYANEATKLWGRHLFLMAKITDRTETNRRKAKLRVDKAIRLQQVLDSADPEYLIAKELQRLNQNDLLRNNLIDEDVFVRSQHDSLCLRAIMYGHDPSSG